MAKPAISPLTLSLFLLLLLFTFALSSAKSQKAGAKVPIPKPERNKEVQAIGKYAVEEYNKKHHLTNGRKGAIVFNAVVKGEQQIVAGVTYYLTISGTINGISKTFDAVVLDQPWIPKRELINFTFSASQKIIPRKEKIPNVKTNKEVQELGKYAVEEYNKEKQQNKTNGNRAIIFSQVVEAEKQLVSGTKYFLKIEAATPRSGILKTFEAVVYVKPWAHYTKLLSFYLSPHAR